MTLALPKLLVVSLGGTITMTRSDTGGIAPTLGAADLVAAVPDIARIAALETLSPMRVASPSLKLEDLVGVAALLERRLAADVDGAVVVQGTDIGLDALADADEVRAWTTDLATGAPLEGVAVAMIGTGAEATTDADGVARMDLASTVPATVLATSGDDSALLPEVWQSTGASDVPLWYVLDDRQVYRPGETVSIKGWVRRLTAGDAMRERLRSASRSALACACQSCGTGSAGTLNGISATRKARASRDRAPASAAFRNHSSRAAGQPGEPE